MMNLVQDPINLTVVNCPFLTINFQPSILSSVLSSVFFLLSLHQSRDFLLPALVAWIYLVPDIINLVNLALNHLIQVVKTSGETKIAGGSHSVTSQSL